MEASPSWMVTGLEIPCPGGYVLFGNGPVQHENRPARTSALLSKPANEIATGCRRSRSADQIE